MYWPWVLCAPGNNLQRYGEHGASNGLFSGDWWRPRFYLNIWVGLPPQPVKFKGTLVLPQFRSQWNLSTYLSFFGRFMAVLLRKLPCNSSCFSGFANSNWFHLLCGNISCELLGHVVYWPPALGLLCSSGLVFFLLSFIFPSL